MSTPSPLLASPNAPFDDDPAGGSTSGPHLSDFPTRTVAIIKTHALAHRFDIERRIQEASFEIVKERQMEIDVEEDPDFLDELFGDDAPTFAEGPVWVYVLERRRAVEVFNTLMGDRNPDVARQEAPNSLRALYGLSLEQNALMGSPDQQTAEIQIASLFASSPPFPSAELPDDKYGSMRSDASSSYLRRTTSNGYTSSNATNPSSAGGAPTSKLDRNGNPHFRARAIPSTHIAPDIQPRTTRAAALRAGMVVKKVHSTPRAPPSKDQLAKTFANVPGHKRAESIAVASTAAPVIAPRMTRAASLRIGVETTPSTPRTKVARTVDAKKTFDGVPGHKRSETITVASVQAPTVAPRLNKSAALRARGDTGPPSSYMFRAATTVKLPGLSRSNSQSSPTPPRPQTARPASQASQFSPPRAAVVRSSSTTFGRPAQSTNGTNGKPNGASNGTSTSNPPAAKPKPRPSSVSTPLIVPRTNRSAALRAAKQEAENTAAADAARKNLRGKFPAQRTLKA